MNSKDTDIARRASGAQQHQRTLVVSAGVSFVGPLPPPEMLAKYEEVQPGLVDRIVSMAEREQAHRHVQEASLVAGELRKQTLGQALGFGVTIAGLATTFGCAVYGHGTTAAIIGTVNLVSVVSVFVLGRRPEAAQRSEPSTSKSGSRPKSGK